jgi:hypothetical protein
MTTARRRTDIYIDNERHTVEAGDEIPSELMELIDNRSVTEGERKHSPGNPTGEESFDDGDEFDQMTVAQLRQYAQENGITINSTKKDDIAAEIRNSA